MVQLALESSGHARRIPGNAAGHAFTPSVDRRFFENIAGAIASLGIDIPALCRRHGIENPLESDGERIPLQAISVLYDCIGLETGDPEYIYRLHRPDLFQGAGTLFQLVSCCRTLQDALRLVSRYSAIASDAVRCSFSGSDAQCTDLIVTPNPSAYVSAYQLEAAIFALVKYQAFVPGARRPLLHEAWFSHGPRFPVSRYELHFGCRVQFHRRQCGVRLSRQALDTPLPGADERLQLHYRRIAEQCESRITTGDALHARVQRLFLQRMAFGEPDIDDIANALHCSARTLQRQLKSSGRSYRELVEEARLDAARQELLTSDRPMHEIAFLVGYSDARAFRRAFLRWTGTTPTSYRDQNIG